MNWTPSDGSRERQESSSSWDVGPTPLQERDARRRHNGLQAINDADFEALIEILGTSGQDRGSDLNAHSLLNNEERSADFEEEGSSVMTVRGPTASGQTDRRRSPEQRETAPSPPPLVAVADTSEPVSLLDLPSAQQTTKGLPSQAAEIPIPTSSANLREPGPSRPPPEPKSERRSRSPMRTEKAENETGTGYTRLSEELSSTVKETKNGIAELRLRLQALKDEVRGFAPQLYYKAFEGREDMRQPSSSKKPKDVENPIAPPRPPSRSEEIKRSVMSKLEGEISEMSNEEVRTVLAKICFSVGLSPTDLKTSANAVTPLNCPPQDLNDVNRALGFLADVDNLVWRRKRRPSGAEDNNKDSEAPNLYTEQNITAIFDRIRLWERTARSSVRRQPQNVANSSQII